MPFSGGTFSLYTPGNPVVTGTTISSTWANTTLSDLADGLSTCLLKDGTQTVTADLPMSGFVLTGLGAANADGESLRYEQLFTTGAVTFLGETRFTVGAALTGAGTGQSDALQLTKTINQVTTAASGTGVKLYASPAAGSWQVIYNGGANPLKVYPQTGAAINQLAANAGFTLQTATSVVLYAVSTTAWIAILSR